MPVTAAELLVKVGWDDTEVERGSRATGDKVEALGGKLKAGAFVLGTAVVGGLVAVTGATMQMQDALTPIGTLVGTTSQQFKDLSAGIKEMVANSPMKAEDLGSAAYAILSAGISDTNTALKALKDSAQLAQAGLGTTAEATNLITSAMNSFKGENLDSTKAAETFFGTVASGKTTTSELAQGFGQIAPLAAAAGVGFTDLMAATAALTSTGQQASVAYSGIKGALTGIIKPSSEAAEMAASLGLEFNQAHLASVGLPKFLDQVQAATKGNVETMAELFGSVEGLNAVLALTGPQADAFKGNLAGISAAGANMQERAKETERTISATFALMKNKLMVLLSDLGQRGFDGLMTFWSAFRQGGGSSIVSGFSVKLVEFGIAARVAFDTIKRSLPAVLEAFRSALGIISTEILPRLRTYFAGMMEAAGVAIKFIKDNWPAISDVMKSVGEVIVALFGLSKAIFDAYVKAISETWREWGDEIMIVVQWVFDRVIPMIQSGLAFIAAAIQTFTALLNGDWAGAWDAVKSALSAAWVHIVQIIRLGMEVVGKIFTGLRSVVDAAAWAAFEPLKTGFTSTINWIIDKWNGLEFKVPTVEVLGVKFGGFTIGVPDVGRIGGEAAFLGSDPEMLFSGSRGGFMSGSSSSSSVAIANVNVSMPAGSSGADVVQALRAFQRANGAIPIAVSGRI